MNIVWFFFDTWHWPPIAVLGAFTGLKPTAVQSLNFKYFFFFPGVTWPSMNRKHLVWHNVFKSIGQIIDLALTLIARILTNVFFQWYVACIHSLFHGVTFNISSPTSFEQNISGLIINNIPSLYHRSFNHNPDGVHERSQYFSTRSIDSLKTCLRFIFLWDIPFRSPVLLRIKLAGPSSSVSLAVVFTAITVPLFWDKFLFRRDYMQPEASAGTTSISR